MKVKATRLGFDGMKRIKVGQEFEAITASEKAAGKKGIVFSERWMVVLNKKSSNDENVSEDVDTRVV